MLNRYTKAYSCTKGPTTCYVEIPVGHCLLAC